MNFVSLNKSLKSVKSNESFEERGTINDFKEVQIKTGFWDHFASLIKKKYISF